MQSALNAPEDDQVKRLGFMAGMKVPADFGHMLGSEIEQLFNGKV